MRLVRLTWSFSLVRFLTVGMAGLATDMALFSLMASAGAAEPLARALSLGIATVLTWQLNRRFTFGDSARRTAAEGGCYAGVALGAQGISYLTFLTVRAAMPALPALDALFCGAVVATAFSYSGQKLFTFRGRVRG